MGEVYTACTSVTIHMSEASCDGTLNGENYFNFDSKNLNIGSWNIRHLIPKLDEMSYLLQDSNCIHVLGLCETFLTNQVNDSRITIDGYNIIRRDRPGQMPSRIY